jgi:fumarate hydratase class II
MTEFRIETDSLGEVSVPADKLELRRHLTHCWNYGDTLHIARNSLGLAKYVISYRCAGDASRRHCGRMEVKDERR